MNLLFLQLWIIPACQKRKLEGILPDKRWVRARGVPVPSARTSMLKAGKHRSCAVLVGVKIMIDTGVIQWRKNDWYVYYLKFGFNHFDSALNALGFIFTRGDTAQLIAFGGCRFWEGPALRSVGCFPGRNEPGLRHHAPLLERMMRGNRRQQLPSKWDIVSRENWNRKMKYLSLHLWGFISKQPLTVAIKYFVRPNLICHRRKRIKNKNI